MLDITGPYAKLLLRIIESKKRGFQANLARKIGMDPGTLNNVIHSRRGTTEENRRIVAEAVGIDYDKFIAMVQSGVEDVPLEEVIQKIDSPKITQSGHGPKAVASNHGDNSTNTAIAGGQPIIDDLRPDVIELAQLIQFAWSPMQIREKIIELRGQIDGVTTGG